MAAQTMTAGPLTRGPILKALMHLALPIVASSFFSTAYNITDMIWIGKLGSTQVAAVGTGGMFLWLFSGMSMLPRMGGQVLTAQKIGAGEREAAGYYSCAAARISAAIGLITGLVCVLFPQFLISLFGVREQETVVEAVRYLRITGGLQVFSFLNFLMSGLFTAQGDSGTPLIANICGLLLNMLLDPFMVLGLWIFPAMGVTGAAVATVLAQLTAFLVFVIVRAARKKTRGYVPLVCKGPIEKKIYTDILKVGLPSALQTMLYCSFSMFLTGMTAGYGSAAIAVQRLGGQIESITWNAADGFGSAMNAFTGQNYGAGKPERIRKGYWFSFGVVAVWGLLITAAFLLFPKPLARLFFFEQNAIDICVSYFRIVGLCEAFMAVELLAIGAINGYGATKVSSAISILLTGMRIPLALLFTRTSMGLDGIWWALSLTSITKGIVLHFAFFKVYSSHPS